MRRKVSIIKEMSKARLLMHFGGMLRAGKINRAQYERVIATWNELHPKQMPIDLMTGAADRSVQSIDRTEKTYHGEDLAAMIEEATSGVQVGDIDADGNELTKST